MKARELAGLGAILAAGFAVRCLATALAYVPTLDTGTVGLMACHILDGARPLYYYGQGYMGALEAYAAAGLAGVFGPSPFVVNLAPILFSLGWITVLWWVMTSLYGRAAGLATAALLALPPWHVLWYSMATYGGYPEAWLPGAGAIAAALCAIRKPAHTTRWCVALGLCTGFGFWVNPQSLMYAAVGWLILTPHVLFRHRQSLPWFALIAICTALVMVPVMSHARDAAHQNLVAWSLDPADWGRRMRGFVLAGLATLVWSREPVGPAWSTVLAVAVIAAAAAATIAVVRADNRRERLLRCAPLAVVAVSLLLALPHSMADENAPRYLIPLWSGLACWMFAMPMSVPIRGVALTARVSLAVWLAAQGVGIGHQIVRRHPGQETARRYRDQLVAASARLGHPYTYLVGNEIFGHYSQPWNFHGAGRTRFVSSFDERCLTTQAAAEAADHTAFAFKPELTEKTACTLAALGATHRQTATDSLSFFHDIALHIPPQVTVRPGTSGPLFDRRADPLGSWPDDGILTIDFPTPIELSGLLLCSPTAVGEGLPDAVEIQVSTDGERFRPVHEAGDRINAGYRAGDRIYLKGYFPAMEILLDPVRVVAIRIHAAAPHPIRINEVLVFASSTDADAGLPVAQCRERMDALGLAFVFADRRQSARLRGAIPPGSPGVALPPYNPKNQASLVRRDFRPAPDAGLLVERRFADDAVHTLLALYGPDIIASRERVGGYDLLALHPVPDSAPRLYWNGFTVLAAPP